MSLKSWFALFMGFMIVTVPVSVRPALAEEDEFDIMGDEEEYEEDDSADYSDENDAFTDSSNTDIAYVEDASATNLTANTSADASLNSGSGLVDVEKFDIAGIMLGMSFEDVYNLYHAGGGLYSMRNRNSLVYTIPEDWKYNLDYECRQSGVVQPSKLAKCIRGLAKKRGLLYVSEIHLVRPKTGEKIDVYLTSNATDNVVYKIVYTNDADETEGTSAKFADQREKKILAFWKSVIKKYGAPNSGNDKWITSTNSYEPRMTAYYDSLELVDEGKHAVDVAEASKQSRENFRPKPYAF